MPVSSHGSDHVPFDPFSDVNWNEEEALFDTDDLWGGGFDSP